MLASASADTTVALWDVDAAGGADARPRVLKGHTNAVKWVAFSPDGATLVSTGLDGVVRLWRVSDATAVRAMVGHRGSVQSALFSPDGRMVASAGDDRTVRLWDVATGESRVVRGHERPVRAVAWAPDGKVVASVGRDGTLQLVKLDEMAQPLFAGHDAGALRGRLRESDDGSDSGGRGSSGERVVIRCKPAILDGTSVREDAYSIGGISGTGRASERSVD